MTPPQVEETQPEQRTPPIQPPASTQKLDEKGSQEERSDQASARDGQDTAVATGAGSTPAKSFAGNSNREGQTARHEGSTSEYTEQEPGQSSIQDAGNDDLLGSLNENTAGLSLEEPLRPDPSVGTTAVAKSPSPPPPPPKDEKFLESVSDEAPSKPLPRNPPPLDTSQNTWSTKGTKDEMAPDESAEMLDDSRSEIQSIIDQFEEGGMGEQEIMSPRLEKAGPLLSSPSFFPPRRSSLEPINSGTQLSQVHSNQSGASIPDNLPPRSSSLLSGAHMSEKSPEPSPEPPPKIYKPPVPLPEPEPDLPFDFHRFLEQLRHRTADPVAKFLRSFLNEFGKKQWMVHEQVKIVSDFLEFISKKMAQCEVWRAVSDAEFDNAREGMEKLVMNRLYSQCFSPAIPSPEPTSDSKGKRKGGAVPLAPGRRGQHQEDVERDEILAQKVRIYGWVKEEHLDIKTVGDKGRKFLKLAQQELLKVNSYRAPRDKVICILNSCKVIFGFLRSSQSDQSADSFVPLLIYTVLQANPDHLVSNVQYILRFRNQEKLGGEAGYYISSLMGAIQFIEALDRTSLTVSDAEFEKNVEAAVSAIAERHSAEERRHLPDPEGLTRQLQPSPQLISEKSTLSRPEVTPRNSLEAERIVPNRSPSRRNGASLLSEKSSDGDGEENAAVAGLLRTIQRPLSTIGRIFSDDGGSGGGGGAQYLARAPATPQPASRLSPALPAGSSPRRSGEETRRSGEQAGNRQFLTPPAQPAQQGQQPQKMTAEDAAALQASAEVEQAKRLQRQEHQVVVETLLGMFPNLDREVIDDVVRMKEGRVGAAVDACLALNN